MTKRILFYSLALIVLAACKKQKTPNLHVEYFGLETGRFVIYDVTEIQHDEDAAIKHDTVNYQLKTVWTGAYLDNEGRTASEYRRYIRETPMDDWALSDIWTGIYDGIRAELIEENQRKIKLVFAPTLSKEWDENAYNNLGELECYYSSVHMDNSVGGTNFDSTVVVEQAEFYSLIDTVRMYEIYAKHVGLVRKYDKQNKYNFGNPTPQKGTEVYYEYVSHGFE